MMQQCEFYTIDPSIHALFRSVECQEQHVLLKNMTMCCQKHDYSLKKDVTLMVLFHLYPQYPELLVASYNNNEDAPHEPDGVALVWNIKFKKATPEYIFHCQVLQTWKHHTVLLVYSITTGVRFFCFVFFCWGHVSCVQYLFSVYRLKRIQWSKNQM